MIRKETITVNQKDRTFGFVDKNHGAKRPIPSRRKPSPLSRKKWLSIRPPYLPITRHRLQTLEELLHLLLRNPHLPTPTLLLLLLLNTLIPIHLLLLLIIKEDQTLIDIILCLLPLPRRIDEGLIKALVRKVLLLELVHHPVVLVLLPRQGESVVEVELLLPRVVGRKLHHLWLQLYVLLSPSSAVAAVVGVGTERPLAALAVVLAHRLDHAAVGDLAVGPVFEGGVGWCGVSGAGVVARGEAAGRRAGEDEVVVERVAGGRGGGEAAAAVVVRGEEGEEGGGWPVDGVEERRRHHLRRHGRRRGRASHLLRAGRFVVSGLVGLEGRIFCESNLSR